MWVINMVFCAYLAEDAGNNMHNICVKSAILLTYCRKMNLNEIFVIYVIKISQRVLIIKMRILCSRYSQYIGQQNKITYIHSLQG